MGRLRGFPARTQTNKRTVTWDLGPNQLIQPMATAVKRLWTNGIVLTNEAQVTIVRMRGWAQVQLNLATAAGDGMIGAVGIGIVSANAFAAGIASVPGPDADAEWDGWLWHQYFHIRGVTAQSAGENIARNANADLRIEIDSKAMRKLKSNEVLFGMWETSVETGTASIGVEADVRVLSKLT